MMLALVDTETTHKDPRPEVDAEGRPVQKAILEYAVRLVDTSSGSLLPVAEYSSLQDPGFPIPPEATEKNHITDDMVKGQEFNQNRFFEILEKAEYIVTHNVPFDRGWLEQELFPAFEVGTDCEQVKWACSLSQIDWSRFPSRHLAYLAWEHEIEIDRKRRHRAMYDVEILHALLDERNRAGLPYWQEMLEKAAQKWSVVFANDAPFETKEMLKADGFFFSGSRSPKVWCKLIPDSSIQATKDFLISKVYGDKRKFPGTILRGVDPLKPNLREVYKLL